MAKLFGADREYPEVDPEDPRFNEIAKQPPNPDVLEEWRHYDVIWEEPHEVKQPGGKKTVYPHQLMTCDCPEHGRTYLVEVHSNRNWPAPTGKGWENRWGVLMACGCTWESGGRIGGGNQLAGWWRNDSMLPRNETPPPPKQQTAVLKKVAVKKVAVAVVKRAASSGKDQSGSGPKPAKKLFEG